MGNSLPKAPIRVALIEEDPALRTMWQISLQHRRALTCVCADRDHRAAARLITEGEPDVIVLDIARHESGEAAIRMLREQCPRAAIIALGDEPGVARLPGHGSADACGSKGLLPHELMDLIQNVWQTRMSA